MTRTVTEATLLASSASQSSVPDNSQLPERDATAELRKAIYELISPGKLREALRKGIQEGLRAHKYVVTRRQGKLRVRKSGPDYPTRKKFLRLARKLGYTPTDLELAGCQEIASRKRSRPSDRFHQ